MNKVNPFFINSRILFESEECLDFRNIFRIAGNTGNCYITYSLIKEIFGYVKKVPHIPLVREYDFSRQEKDIEYINAECSHVFLVLQDQIRAPEDMNDPLPFADMMNFISKLNKPIIVAGFGANNPSGFDASLVKRLPPDLVNFLKFLSDYCISIGVRGFFTEEIFHALGINNVLPIGCPSFYENGADRVIKKPDLSQKEIENKSILTSMMDCYLSKDTPCCLQDEYDVVRRIREGDIFLNYHKNFFFTPSIDAWKDFLKNFSFAYGTRMHGSILAINSGIPAVVMNKDSRAREMCELMHIPYLPHLREYRPSELFEHCNVEDMNLVYPKLYENFKNFMKENGIEITSPNNTVENCCPDFVLYPDTELPALEKGLVESIEKIQDDFDYMKRYPQWLIKLLCLFIPNRVKRKRLRGSVRKVSHIWKMEVAPQIG